MRWRRQREAMDLPTERIDWLDVESLEVIELDADGRPVDVPPRPADDAIPELPNRPSRRDPTGTAGIWEALANH